MGLSPWNSLIKILVFLLISDIKPLSATLEFGKITCSKKLNQLDLTNSIDEVVVQCPHSCLDGYCSVRGSNPYTSSSSLCCAGIHCGVLDNSVGGKILIKINYSAVPDVYGSQQNGIKSRDYLGTSYMTFTAHEVEKNTNQLTPKVHSTTEDTLLDNTSPANKQLHHFTTQESTTVTTKPEIQTVPTVPATTRAPVLKNLLFALHEIKYAENRTDSRSSTALNLVSRSSENTRNTVAETTNSFALSSTAASKLNTLMHDHPTLIGTAAGAFLFGIAVSLLLVCVYKRFKKRHLKQSGHCSRKTFNNYATSRDELDVCVCYQNLNTSRQGLLTDPETCDRPCPIRKPLMSDQDVFERSLACDNALMRDVDALKRENECDNKYGDCASGCDSKCNPQRFDF